MATVDSSSSPAAGRPDSRSSEPADERRSLRIDCTFTALVVLLSALPYVAGLGLYSDDWAILANLEAAEGSLRRMWTMLMDMGVSTRPVQGILLIALHAVFGLEPLGYHLSNTAALAAAAVLFHLSLRRLGVPRPVALAAPLVFALLPHYSTDRFWIAAYQATASVLLYFLSLYSDLRFIGSRSTTAWTWKAVGTLALIASVLAYEVTGALFLVNIVVVGYAAGLRRPLLRTTHRRVLIGLVLNLVALATSIAFKLVTTERAGLSGGLRFRALRIFTEGVPVHFGEYGAALPARVLTVLRHHPDAFGLVLSILVGVITCVYLMRAWGTEPVLARVRTWLALLAAGVVLFVAGYGVSLTTWEIGFHATGANNRTAIGAAIGTALVFTGTAGLASTLLGARLQRVAFALLISFIASAGALVISAVGGHWVRASERQDEIIEIVHRTFPALPAGTILLLAGLCPYVGPAPVFATDWDVKGMLEIEYGERSLNGDVIKPNTEVRPEGVRTTLFDDWIKTYPYGSRLRVLHVATGATATLAHEGAALDWVRGTAVEEGPSCPPYTDGDGADVF